MHIFFHCPCSNNSVSFFILEIPPTFADGNPLYANSAVTVTNMYIISMCCNCVTIHLSSVPRSLFRPLLLYADMTFILPAIVCKCFICFSHLMHIFFLLYCSSCIVHCIHNLISQSFLLSFLSSFTRVNC